MTTDQDNQLKKAQQIRKIGNTIVWLSLIGWLMIVVSIAGRILFDTRLFTDMQLKLIGLVFVLMFFSGGILHDKYSKKISNLQRTPTFDKEPSSPLDENLEVILTALRKHEILLGRILMTIYIVASLCVAGVIWAGFRMSEIRERLAEYLSGYISEDAQSLLIGVIFFIALSLWARLGERLITVTKEDIEQHRERELLSLLTKFFLGK